MLWVVGGVAALCGALTYAELGDAARSGGKHNFLSRIYHPAAGFVSGWVRDHRLRRAGRRDHLRQLSLGSCAGDTSEAGGCCARIALTVAHASTRSIPRRAALVHAAQIAAHRGVLCIGADACRYTPPVSFLPDADGFEAMLSPAFAVALIYVSYAYTGWNAATYLTSEMEAPQQSLPRVLWLGTSIVLVLYVALNFTFLYAAPMSEMAGKVEVGYVAASFVYGERGGAIMGIVLALLLVSTVSAMTIAGPRVLAVIGEDFRAFSWFARTNATGLPVLAIVFQCALGLLFIFVSSFEEIIRLAGFTLGLNSFLTVLGVFVLRVRQPDLPRPYRTAWFPVPPLIYLSITGWTLVYLALSDPTEAMVAFAIVFAGLIFYFGSRRLGSDQVSADSAP